MERRTFFGVLGLVGGLFGLDRKTKGGVPIIDFDQYGNVTNLAEIFKNSTPHACRPNFIQDVQYAKAWLKKEDLLLFGNLIRHYQQRNQRLSVYFGVVLLKKVTFVPDSKGNCNFRLDLHCLPDSLHFYCPSPSQFDSYEEMCQDEADAMARDKWLGPV